MAFRQWPGGRAGGRGHQLAGRQRRRRRARGYMGYRVPLLEAGVHLYELKAQGQSGDAGVFGSSGASLHTRHS